MTRRAMPFIAAAPFFPPPAAAVLNPNPLATLIVPLPAGDGERCEPEGVFIAILGDAVADNHAGIADGAGDGQFFKIGLG